MQPLLVGWRSGWNTWGWACCAYPRRAVDVVTSGDVIGSPVKAGAREVPGAGELSRVGVGRASFLHGVGVDVEQSGEVRVVACPGAAGEVALEGH